MEKKVQKIGKHLNKYLNKYSAVFQGIWCCVMYFIIEAFSRHSITQACHFIKESPWVFLYNSLLLFMTMMIVYLFRRRFFVRILISALWLYLGYMNGTILNSRVTPFTGQDIHLIEDAMDILDKYMTPGKLVENISLVLVTVVILFLFWRFAPKYKEKVHHIRGLIACIAVILFFAGATKLALEKRIISNYFGNIAFAFEDYGFPYCFCCTLFGTGIDKPYDYSKEKIDEIISESSVNDNAIEVASATKEGKEPNIIFVQLESFFDVSTVEYLTCSSDPIPYFHSLMQEYSSGSFKVPSVGAGTANTEFESISGMNMRYFGAGEYPYKTILKKTTCESIPYVLKSIGYATHAIHNNKATFYSRVDVFPNLGFDSFTTKEYMDISNQTPTGWVKDDVLVGSIMDAMSSTERPDYIYTISVQGHGDYPTERVLENPKISVTGSSTMAKNHQWEYYVNQIYEMDQFVKKLIETVDDYGEDAVIVFYGDHLPTMGLTEEDVSNRYLFDTSYVIWDNMGLEKKDGTICAYQIGAEVLNKLNIHAGVMTQYHQERNGTKNYQSDMEMLQYDILYGKHYAYGESGPHKAADMQMGVKPITISDVVQIEDSVYVFGENLTTQSKIYINGEYCSTGYINDHMLRVKKTTLENGDEVKVNQLAPGSKRRILSEGNILIYYNPKGEQAVVEG